MEWIIHPAKGLSGTVCIPADRSIARQAVIIGSIAEGITTIEGTEMWLRTASGVDGGGDGVIPPVLRAMQMLGVPIREVGGNLVVHGQGLRGLRKSEEPIYAGDLATLQLLSGLLAGQPFEVALGGDASLRRCPMGGIIEPLRRMGVHVAGVIDPSSGDEEYPPLTLCGGPLRGIRHEMPAVGTPVKAAILLAGLYADGSTTVVEPLPSVDHTERMLSAFGAKVECGMRVADCGVRDKESEIQVDETEVSAELQRRIRRLQGEPPEQEVMETSVLGHPALRGQHVTVPGDVSLSAFFFVAGTIVPRSEIRVERVGLNPTRRGIIEVLRRMGAVLQVENEEESAGEPFGDVVVQSSELKRIRIAGPMVPRVMNEIPVLAVAATQVEGDVILRDAQDLRSLWLPQKETDRIRAVVENLRKMGGKIGEMPDGFIIEGGRPLVGARVRSFGDPWIAMAFAVAGLIAEGETVIEDAECTDRVFPGFYQQLDALRRT